MEVGVKRDLGDFARTLGPCRKNDSVSYWRWFFVCLVASRPVSTTLGLEMLFQNRPVLTG